MFESSAERQNFSQQWAPHLEFLLDRGEAGLGSECQVQQAVLLLTRLERTLHEAVSGMQNASVAADKTRARAAVLERLLQDKELLMLNLSESMDQLRISSDRSVGEYELQMAELHGIICKLKDSRGSLKEIAQGSRKNRHKIWERLQNSSPRLPKQNAGTF